MILEKEFTEDEELLYLASYVVKQASTMKLYCAI